MTARTTFLRTRRLLVGMLAVAAPACAPAMRQNNAAQPTPIRVGATSAETSPSGTLRQDELSVRMMIGELRIEVTPLVPWILESAAPDTRRRLERIADAHSSGMGTTGMEGPQVLFLVSFSSSAPDTEYMPHDLHMSSRGLRQRPRSIHGITPDWGSQRLAQHTTAAAVFAYGGELDLTRELIVSYQGEDNSTWSTRLAAIEVERARIQRQ